MFKIFHLRRPSFQDWLFGIRPAITVGAKDGPGDESRISLREHGVEIGIVVVRFSPDPIVEVKEAIDADKK